MSASTPPITALPAAFLPLPWQQQPRWHVLLTEVAHGHDLLALWAAWQADPLRPRHLYLTAICPVDWQVSPDVPAGWASQAEQLRSACWGLLPGVHRLDMADGQLHLTLWVGAMPAMLRQQSSRADAILLPCRELDGHVAKTLARHCRRGSLLYAPRLSAQGRQALQSAGFAWTESAPSSATAVFAPRWEPKLRDSGSPPPVHTPAQALIIGAGLAGAAMAHSLAQRGWQVTVLAQSKQPADGASGLPAGLFCPHVSPDDSVLSRLSRNGVRMTLQRLQALCEAGRDWAPSGVLEHCTDGGTGLPEHASHTASHAWSRPATPAQLQDAHLHGATVACWHTQAGWVRPAQLVQAQLQHPNIQFHGEYHVARIERKPDGQWQALDAQSQVLASADLVVVASGAGTAQLLPAAQHWGLQAIRGQITWGLHTAEQHRVLPPFPVNGNGNLVTHVPLPQGPSWVMGSTFERDVTSLPISEAEQAAAHRVNHGKLSTLIPATSASMAPWFEPSDPRCHPTWGQVRCASHDRLPIAGPVSAQQPGLWVLSALGARGLTLSVLCAELIAARLHAEPLPIDAKLASHLGTERLQRKTAVP